MYEISGYVKLLIKHRVGKQQEKALFGKPFVKMGTCIAMYSYFLQLGAILGARHANYPKEFAHAFLGADETKPGAVNNFFETLSDYVISNKTSGIDTFLDYTYKEIAKKLNDPGPIDTMLFRHGMKKVDLTEAMSTCWHFASQGAAIGVKYPELVREMFELTHRPASKESWNNARKAGLDIPEDQDIMSYHETESGEDEPFMLYCQEFCIEYYNLMSI